MISRTYLEIAKHPAPRDLRLRTVDLPRIGKGDILARPVCVGLCGSDLRIITNEKEHQPGGIGHEAALKIVCTGQDVKGFSPDDLITINPFNPQVFDDIIGYNGTGFLANLFKISADLLEQQRAFKFPQGTDPEVASFAEPLACCIQAQDRIIDKLPNSQVLIIGSGSFGLLHYQLAKDNGAKDVFVSASSRLRLNQAVKQGVLNENETVWEEGSWTKAPLFKNGWQPSVVIVTANNVAPVIDALNVVRKNGTVVLFGGLKSHDRINSLNLSAIRKSPKAQAIFFGKKKVTLSGSYGTYYEHFIKSVSLLSKSKLDVLRIISHLISLEGLIPALNQPILNIIDGRPVLKILVTI